MVDLAVNIAQSKLNRTLFKTPFTRSFVELPVTQCVEDANFNFDSYTLFVLKYKLAAYVLRLKRRLEVNFTLVPEERENVMYVYFTDGLYDVNFDETQTKTIQELINVALSKYPRHTVVLNSNEAIIHNHTYISEGFLKEVFPILTLDPKYNSFVEDDYLYTDFTNDIDYLLAYGNLQIDLINQIQKHYESSLVISDRATAKKLRLVPKYDREESYDYYLPLEATTRSLLLKFMSDVTVYRFPIEEWGSRHYLTQELNKRNIQFMYRRHDVVVVTNPTQYPSIVTLVEVIQRTKQHVQVGVVPTRSLDFQPILQTQIDMYLPGTLIVMSLIDRLNFPYVFTFEVPPGSDVKEITDIVTNEPDVISQLVQTLGLS